jgi:type III secretion protein J
MTPRGRAALIGIALLACACGQQTALRQNLDETQANDVLATLARYGIAAKKTARDDTFAISVDPDDFTRAVAVLREEGLPPERHATLGSIFRKEGMMSTPLEERARYLYALSQELEQTLRQINGVIDARVHVVLPERPSPGDVLTPASAAVFIKHRPGVAIELAVPRITRLVTHSLPGLANAGPGSVAVVLTATTVTQTPEVVQQESAVRKKRDVRRHAAWGALALTLVLAAGAGAWYAMRRTAARIRAAAQPRHGMPPPEAPRG